MRPVPRPAQGNQDALEAGSQNIPQPFPALSPAQVLEGLETLADEVECIPFYF